MNPKNRAERVIALKAIQNEAEKLADSGADALDVQGFISGARQELVNQRPDPETYKKAAMAAKMSQEM